MKTNPAAPGRGCSTHPTQVLNVWRGAWSSRSLRVSGMLAGVLVWMAMALPAWAAGPPGLLAPLYPKAVLIEPPGEKTCPQDEGNCDYASKDPIDKVKAFYAKTFGAPQVQDFTAADGRPHAFVPLETYYYNGEDGAGQLFLGVNMEGRVPAPWPATDAEAEALIRSLENFAGFREAVNWSRGEGPGFTGLHSIGEMKALYGKYSYLNARYFPLAPEGGTTDQPLRRKYAELADTRVEKAKRDSKAKSEKAQQNMQQNMMSQMATRQQELARGGSAQDKGDDAEMRELMKRKPRLRAQLDPLSTQIVDLTNAGKYEEAGAVGDKMDKIMRSDPEVAALLDKQDKRLRARDTAGSAQIQQFMQTMSHDMVVEATRTRADALWNTWSEYLAALARQESFATRIRIDRAEDREKAVHDRAAVLKIFNQERAAAGGRSPSDRLYGKGEPAASGGAAAGKQEAAPASSSQPEQTAQAAPAKKKKEQKQEQKQKDKQGDAKDEDTLGGAAKQGMNLLKKLF